MAILGDFGEFEGPVPEPPYSYHHTLMRLIRNYVYKKLNQFSPKHKDYMFFFIFLSKPDEKHRLVAFYRY